MQGHWQAKQTFATSITIRLCSLLKNFTEEKPIAPLILVASLKDTSDNCGLCESEAVWVLAYLLGDDAKESYGKYIDSEISIDALLQQETWLVVINALIQQILNKNVLQKVCGLLTGASQKPNKKSWKSKSNFLKLQDSRVMHFDLRNKLATMFVARSQICAKR